MTRFRLTEQFEPEAQFAVWFRDYLNTMLLPPAVWNLYPAGHIQLTPAQQATLSRAGLRPGWPDYLIVHHRIYGIELKRPGGRLTKGRMIRTRRGALVWRPGQEETFPLLEAAGMLIAVCVSREAVIGALKGWGIPLRRTT